MTTATLERKETAPVASSAEVRISADALAKAMRFASSIVETANTIPILANVRLIAQGDEIELTTCDMDVEFRQVVALVDPVQERFATTVDARRLHSLVQAVAPGAVLSLSLENGRMIVKAGRSRWVLPVLPATDFPTIPVENMCDPVKFEPASKLATAIDRVLWSASTEITRYYLCGVFLDSEDGKLRLVTTNGNTLAAVTTGENHPGPDGVPAIMASKYAQTLMRLSESAAGVVAIAWNERLITARLGLITLTGKLIQGSYPDYRRVFPIPGEHVVIEPEVARSALKRVKLVSSSKTRSVKVEKSADLVVLSLIDPDGGTAREEIPASCDRGFETGFNVDYLENMLEAVGGDSVEIHHADAAAPALIRRVVPDGMIGVVMPMRV